jgi:polysaccharide export outer membrane protein
MRFASHSSLVWWIALAVMFSPTEGRAQMPSLVPERETTASPSTKLNSDSNSPNNPQNNTNSSDGADPTGSGYHRDYTLGTGDRIQIDIFEVPQYSGQREILVGGNLQLPPIGSISVEGLTLEAAASAIAEAYEQARILRNPRVTVTLTTPRPLRIGIAGEIQRPGSYTLEFNGSQFPTLTQAIQTAGGITQAADLRRVQVRSCCATNKTITANLWKLLQTGNLQSDIPLRDGDTIVIPTAEQIDIAESNQLAAASFATDQTQPVDIAVLGEVRRPGPHAVTGEGGPGGKPTVTEALQTAGGIQPLADIRNIQVRRTAKNGTTQTIHVNLMKLLQDSQLQQDLILQDGDIVVVPTVTETNLAEISQLRSASFAPEQTQPINVDILGEVRRPGPHTVTGQGGPEGAPTVTQALQVAGGIDTQADIRQIEVRRQTSTGEQRSITVNLWKLLQAEDTSQDIILQEGDTIVVPTAEKLQPGETTQLAEASFAPETITVNIVGEVRSPGGLQLPPNTPLNQALLAAGGFNNRAKTASVKLIRLQPNGTVTQRKISVDFEQGVDEQENPVLRSNDTIIVGRSFLASVGDVLDTTLGPINRFLNVLGLPARLRDVVDTLQTD